MIQTTLFLLAMLLLVYAFRQKAFAEEAMQEALADKMAAEQNAHIAWQAVTEASRLENNARQVADSLLTELNKLKLSCK